MIFEQQTSVSGLIDTILLHAQSLLLCERCQVMLVDDTAKACLDTAVRSTRSTQPCIPPGSLNRVPALAGVRAGMSPLPGGR